MKPTYKDVELSAKNSRYGLHKLFPLRSRRKVAYRARDLTPFILPCLHPLVKLLLVPRASVNYCSELCKFLNNGEPDERDVEDHVQKETRRGEEGFRV